MPEHSGERPLLHNAAGIEHRDRIGIAGDKTQVVRDQDQTHAGLALQLAQELEDLRLHRHIERCSRFVGDQHPWLQRYGHGDQDALPHAT